MISASAVRPLKMTTAVTGPLEELDRLIVVDTDNQDVAHAPRPLEQAQVSAVEYIETAVGKAY